MVNKGKRQETPRQKAGNSNSSGRQQAPMSTSPVHVEATSQLADEILQRIRTEVGLAVAEALAVFQAEIDMLREENNELKKRMASVENECELKIDDLEQYGRRTSLRVFGVPEKSGESTDNIVIKLCKEKLDVDLKIDDIHRSHRVGRLQEPGQQGSNGKDRHRPIIVRFDGYRTRQRVFAAKKALKGTGITIREDLTRHRLALFNAAADRYGIRNVWTIDGRIKFAVGEGAARRIHTAERLADLR
jgi:FtsZ-binding cell division protein ZapB